MADTKTKLEQALKLARLGFYIAPLRKGSKQPEHGESWLDIRTRDEDTIRGWFEYRPSMNYVVSPGDSFVIVDLDTKEVDGVKIFEDLAREYEDVPTLLVETPSGGQHRYFRVPWPVTNSNIFPTGIDTRGTRGYVLGPGCELIEGLCGERDIPGEYKLLSTLDIEQAPDWILNYCTRVDYQKQDEPDYDREAVDFADAKEILSFINPDIEYHEWIKVALGLKAARINDLEDRKESREVFREWSRGDYWPGTPLKYDPGNIDHFYDSCGGPKAGGVHFGSLVFMAEQGGYQGRYSKKYDYKDQIISETDPDDFSVMEANKESEEEQANTEEKLNAWDKKIKVGEEIRTISPAPHLIHEWLPNRGVTGIIAFRGHGKTVVMLDLALMLSVCEENNEQEWYETPLPKDKTVIYLCGEDPENTARNHVEAWVRKNNEGVLPKRFLFVTDVPNLLDGDNINSMIASTKNRLKREGLEDTEIVLFFDTWQRGTIGLSQVEEKHMSVAVTNAENIGKRFGDCPVVIAFHPPKGARLDPKLLTISGTGQLENVTTALWHLFPVDPEDLPISDVNLKVERIKGPGSGAVRRLKYELFKLEEDKENKLPRLEHPTTGEVLTGIVVKCTESDTATQVREKKEKEKQKRTQEKVNKLVEEIDKRMKKGEPGALNGKEGRSIASISGKTEKSFRESLKDFPFKRKGELQILTWNGSNYIIEDYEEEVMSDEQADKLGIMRF